MTPTADGELVRVHEGAPHVALVEISRPPLNSLDVELVRSLAAAVRRIDDDPRLRVSVVCSTGKVFCAGADVSSVDPAAPPGLLYREAMPLFDSRKPIVAAVQGAAVGGGLGLAMVADFRIAAPTARFVGNFARLGFHHGFGLTETLPAVVGQQFALEMLLTGRRIRGAEALRRGLADRLVPLAALRSEAVAFATEIAHSAPLAVAATRATFRSGRVRRIEAAIEHEVAEQARLRRTSDFGEGVRALAERRPPSFDGR